MQMTAAEGDPKSLKEEMGDLDTTTPEEKEVSSKKEAPKKKTPAKKKEAKAADPNVISLKDLAAEHKLTTAAARRKLRAAGLKADGRWSWEKDSPALKKAVAALEVEEDEKDED